MSNLVDEKCFTNEGKACIMEKVKNCNFFQTLYSLQESFTMSLEFFKIEKVHFLFFNQIIIYILKTGR